MGENNTLNTIHILMKISYTILSGTLRILLQIIFSIPKAISKALTILMKLGVIYRLVIEPLLRSIGAFFGGLWRAAMQRRASSKIRKEQARDINI